MKSRLIARAMVLAVALLVGTSVLASGSVRAASPSASTSTGSLMFPIITTVNCTAVGVPSNLCTAAGQTLSFSGTGSITSFQVVNGVVTAVGTYTGTLTNTTTQATTTLSGTLSGALTGGTGSCQILNLTIGPIYLNLLGLVVQTNTVNLTITAQQGPGNLLGNLLCAVANLLNGNGSATALATLLNQLLAGL
jgi:hypothetical protein